MTPEKSGGTNFQSRWNHLPCVCAFEKSGGTGFGLADTVLVLLPLSAYDFGGVAFEECSKLVPRVSGSVVTTSSWQVRVEVFGSDLRYRPSS